MGKRVPPLTSAQFANLKADPAKVLELVDGAVPGLRVRITPAGMKSWSLNIRAAGVMRRFDVGSGLGLSDARKKAEDLRRRIRDGADPTAERRALRARAQAANEGIGTLNALLDGYFANGPGSGLRTKTEQMRRIRSVFAKYLSQPALEIDGVALQLAADAHSSKTSAARAVAYLQPVIKWAAKRGLIKNVFDLEKPTVGDDESDGLGQRVLSAKELLILLPHFYGSSRGRCCEFLLLTGARLREATEATWDEIDFERAIWTISAGRRKDTRSRTRRKQVPTLPHVVPLSRQALKILDEARAEEKSRRERLGLATTISPTDPVFVGERGGILQNWDRWLKLVALTTGFTGWSAHALRRTAATMAANLGGEPHVISVLLGHKNIGGQLTAGYNKSRYLREHTEILQKLGDHVDSIRGGFTNLVIPLRSA